jgi:hypothetical protein
VNALALANGNETLQRKGTCDWDVTDLTDLCRLYHGPKGAFAYAAVRWCHEIAFAGTLPVPLVQWALTPYGGCLGNMRPDETAPPVITLHPAIWSSRFRLPSDRKGWAARIPAGVRYTLDVIVHELAHVDVEYVRGGPVVDGKIPHSSHDNPRWCESTMAASARLRGTLLEVPGFVAQPTRRFRARKGAPMQRRTPEGCLPMADVARWPHSLRPHEYHRERTVPFDWRAQ